MTNTYRYLFAPAATMTKLEAVTVEIFSRQMAQQTHGHLMKGYEPVAKWAIEAALQLLTLLDEYQRDHDPQSYSIQENRARIVQFVKEKNLVGEPLEEILCDRYGVNKLCDLGLENEADLVNYLESI